MKITLTSGTGEGTTELAAFDKALHDAGIAHYNLVKISSVIPEGSEIEVSKINPGIEEYGRILFVVMAEKREYRKGKRACAGLGWVQDKDGRGLFVEHEGNSEEQVKNSIEETLTSMQEYREQEFGEIKYKITGVDCNDKPGCALVAAVYKSIEW